MQFSVFTANKTEKPSTLLTEFYISGGIVSLLKSGSFAHEFLKNGKNSIMPNLHDWNPSRYVLYAWKN